MKPLLIVDENLPLEVVDIFAKFLPVTHVNNLKRHSKQKISDDQLRKLSLNRDCVIITKDDDFVSSWVNRKVPKKVIFVYLEGKKEALLAPLETYAQTLIILIEEYDFIEVSEKGLRLPFEIPIPYEK